MGSDGTSLSRRSLLGHEDSMCRNVVGSSTQGVGDRVLNLVASATSEVIVVSPFITKYAIARVVESCPEDVPVSVVGRFLPQDLAAKVSDLEAIEFLLDAPNVEIASHALLHGKLFRADRRCLVGSANVTCRALGWSRVSNVELLVECDYDPVIEAFEREVRDNSERMTESRLRELRARVSQLEESESLRDPDRDCQREGLWIPKCRTPRYIYDVYIGEDEWRMLASAKAAATEDLRDLGPFPKALDRVSFEGILRGVLLSHPLTTWAFEIGEVTDELAVRKIEELQVNDLESNIDSKFLWEIFQEWVQYFLADRIQEVATTKKIVFRSRL